MSQSGTPHFGVGSFDDEFAIDWLEDLLDSSPIEFFAHCLDLSDQDDLNRLACVGVVCTAEMVAGLTGGPRPGWPELAHRWLRTHTRLRPAAVGLVPDAIAGLDRVLRPGSALSIRWSDQATDCRRWREGVEALRNDLRSAASRRRPVE